MNRRTLSASALILTVAFAAGFMQEKPKRVDVTIEDTQFKPDEITIKKGQMVRWTNKDNRDHLILAKDQSFKSENLKPGEHFEHTFKEAGTFDYISMYRPRMLGQVKVEE